MKKTYETVEIQTIRFEAEDIVTASGQATRLT